MEFCKGRHPFHEFKPKIQDHENVNVNLRHSIPVAYPHVGRTDIYHHR